MRKIVILITCLTSSLLQGQISIDTVANYKSWGWKAIVMQNDLITMATVPAIGARVMQYDLGNFSSIYINPSEFGNTHSPNQYIWYNFGGYKTWPSPQYDWHNQWPPPPILDYGSYTYQISSPSNDSVNVFVTSQIEKYITPNIQFERRATIYSGTSRVKMDQTMINQGKKDTSWGMWSIVQAIVNHPDETDYENFWAYFPINPNSVYGESGAYSPDGSSDAWKGEVAPGVYGVQYNADGKKIYADPQKGWIAYTDLLNGVVYSRTFDIFEGERYPDSARVSVYVSSGYPAYMEVEVKGPIVKLSANGGQYTFTENWWAAKVRAPVLDVNPIGAIAGRMLYNSVTQNLSAIYGVFHNGTARVAFVDSLGQTLSEGQSYPVSPLAEFQLQESVVIPGGAKTVKVRVYNTKDEFIGILDSADVLNLITEIKGAASVQPSKFHLEQNYPNPFNPATVIGYQLPVKSYVTLKIYDVLGREVSTLVNENESAGHKSVTFNASSLPSGVYFYKMTANPTDGGQAATFSEVKKLTIVK